MMVFVKVKKLGNCALQIYAGEVITPRKVVFLAVFFITDDAQMVSWLVLLPHCPEDSSSNHGAGDRDFLLSRTHLNYVPSVVRQANCQ